MTEAVEGGASLAWRLLATLEGGSIILATSALLLYTARNRVTEKRSRNVHSVLITNTKSLLGKELKRQLEAHGCVVNADTNANIRTNGENAATVDALVVVGAEPKSAGLDGIAELVSDDVYSNLKLLESLSIVVRPGGCIAWACAGATSGPFSGAGAAFDNVLNASLQHVANKSQCEPIWLGRCENAKIAAERLVAALKPCATQQFAHNIRNAAKKVSEYLYRWLKIVK